MRVKVMACALAESPAVAGLPTMGPAVSNHPPRTAVGVDELLTTWISTAVTARSASLQGFHLRARRGGPARGQRVGTPTCTLVFACQRQPSSPGPGLLLSMQGSAAVRGPLTARQRCGGRQSGPGVRNGRSHPRCTSTRPTACGRLRRHAPARGAAGHRAARLSKGVMSSRPNPASHWRGHHVRTPRASEAVAGQVSDDVPGKLTVHAFGQHRAAGGIGEHAAREITGALAGASPDKPDRARGADRAQWPLLTVDHGDHAASFGAPFADVHDPPARLQRLGAVAFVDCHACGFRAGRPRPRRARGRPPGLSDSAPGAAPFLRPAPAPLVRNAGRDSLATAGLTLRSSGATTAGSAGARH